MLHPNNMWKLSQANCRNTVAGNGWWPLTAGGSSPVLQIWKRHIMYCTENPEADPVIRTDTRLGCHQFRGKKSPSTEIFANCRTIIDLTWRQPDRKTMTALRVLCLIDRYAENKNCHAVHWHFRSTTRNNVNFPEKLINPKWRTTAATRPASSFDRQKWH